MISADFARQLERELAEAKESEESETRWAAQYKAERDRLAEALEYCLKIIGPPNKDPEWWSDCDCDKAWNDGQAALAAVKGGKS